MTDKRLAILAGSALALSLAAAGTAAADTFEEFDLDSNIGVSEDEFRNGFDSVQIFGNWDADGNGVVSDEEFERVVHGR